MDKKGAKNLSNSDLGFLDDLGSSKSEFSEITNEDYLIDAIVTNFISRVKNNISDLDMISTGKMSDMYVIKNGDVIEIYAPEYIIYKDMGVSGTETKYDTPFSYIDKMPPIESIIAWIKQNKHVLRNSKDVDGKISKFEKTEDEKIKSMAFAIAKNIQKNGQKPMNFLEKEVEQMTQELSNEIPNLIIKSVFDSL